MNALVDQIPTLEIKKKRFEVVPRHLAHDVGASDCVFGAVRAAYSTSPRCGKQSTPFCSENPGVYPILSIGLND